MKPISLIGKSIKIVENKDGKPKRNYEISAQLIAFFYPHFTLRRTHLYYDKNNDVIFMGKDNSFLSSGTRSFIDITCVGDSCAIDFTDRLEILRFVYSKWGLDIHKVYSDMELQRFKAMGIWQFYNFVKHCWCSKRVCFRLKEQVRFDTRDLIGKDYPSLVRELEAINERYHELVEKEILKFIHIAKFEVSKGGQQDLHKRQIYQEFDEHFDEDYISAVLSKYRCMQNTPKIKLLWLLYQFSF